MWLVVTRWAGNLYFRKATFAEKKEKNIELYMAWKIAHEKKLNLFKRVLAVLWEVMSVHWSVGPLVCQSFGRSCNRLKCSKRRIYSLNPSCIRWWNFMSQLIFFSIVNIVNLHFFNWLKMIISLWLWYFRIEIQLRVLINYEIKRWMLEKLRFLETIFEC